VDRPKEGRKKKGFPFLTRVIDDFPFCSRIRVVVVVVVKLCNAAMLSNVEFLANRSFK
jgi:hypothetical protein